MDEVSDYTRDAREIMSLLPGWDPDGPEASCPNLDCTIEWYDDWGIDEATGEAAEVELREASIWCTCPVDDGQSACFEERTVRGFDNQDALQEATRVAAEQRVRRKRETRRRILAEHWEQRGLAKDDAEIAANLELDASVERDPLY